MSASATGQPEAPASGAIAHPHGPDHTPTERPEEVALIASSAAPITSTAGLARRTSPDALREDSTSQLAATASTAKAVTPATAPTARPASMLPGPPARSRIATPATAAPTAAPSNKL